jgi:hypothetical protein
MAVIYDTRPQDSIGTSTVDIITQGEANHGWQTLDPRNDDGVDGIIFLRKRKGNVRVDTGDIIFAQVKCGSPSGYYTESKKRPKHFGVNVGSDYIASHRPKWKNLFGPVILIYVDYKTRKAWWTDLKDDKSYTDENKSIILISKSQRFGTHSFGEFKKLKGHLHISPDITNVVVKKIDVDIFRPSVKIKDSARSFYRSWALSQDRFNPELGEIIVSREGWRHTCRKGRKAERIVQSWSLLGVAKKMIQEVSKIYQLRVESSIPDSQGNYSQIDYISLRANVNFPQRHSCIVQVILKRRRKFNVNQSVLESKIWFYSVYEPLATKAIR